MAKIAIEQADQHNKGLEIKRPATLAVLNECAGYIDLAYIPRSLSCFSEAKDS